jgi:membrane-associated phospholipid phosphatase
MDSDEIGGRSPDAPQILCKDRLMLVFFFFALILAVVPSGVHGQNSEPVPSPSASPSPEPAASPEPSLEKHFITNVLKDQYGIWTAPFRFRRNDLHWLLPLAGSSAAFFATDEQTAHFIDNNSTRLKISHGLSAFGSGYAVGGAALSIYLIGRTTHNSRSRETGVLAFEALIDTGIVTQVFKSALQRSRPLQRDGEGEFFTHGSSFISGHSSSIWSLAAVVNDEYGKRHPFVRYGMFGLATAVSVSRYTGRNHFLSDILLGGAIGYGIGHFVYLRHHDTDLENPDVTTKPVTKLEKYFPRIEPAFNSRTRTYGVAVAWNF